jgi:hypothetical protein
MKGISAARSRSLLADYSEYIEFFGHHVESKRLDTAPQPLARHWHQGSFDDAVPTMGWIAPAALDFYLRL